MRAFAVILAFLIAPVMAFAQGAIQQSGRVVSGHPMVWFFNGIAGDGGTATNGVLSGVGVQNPGNGICQNSGPVTAQFAEICLGFTAGVPTISTSGPTGGSTLLLNLGGTTYTLPGSASCLGCGTMAQQNANAVAITGGTITNIDLSAISLSVSGAATFNGVVAFNATLSGAGITSLFASPLPIGSTAPNTGAFTNLSGTGIVSGAGFAAAFSQQNAIIPGCVGNGVTDDTICVQAALNSGGSVYLGSHIYAINSTGLVCNTLVQIRGTQGNQPSGYATVSGFRPITTNTNVLTINSGCSGSEFHSFSMDMGAHGTNTSGDAIIMGTSSIPINIVIEDVSINAPCIGVDVNGNQITLNRVRVTQIAGALCGGIRVGHLTTNAVTVDARITNSYIQSNQTSAAAWGMRIEDAGGLFLENNDVLYSNFGTEIIPGTSQEVLWLFAVNTVFGDTTTNSPLYIDTAASNAVILGLQMTSDWTANNTAGPGIVVQNTAGGNVSGIWFDAHRHLGGNTGATPYDNIVLNIPTLVSDITIKNSHICGGATTGSASGITLIGNVSYVAIEHNQINQTCASTRGVLAAAINLGGNNGNLIIEGNDICGATSPIDGTPISTSIVSNNRCVETSFQTVASANTIALTTVAPKWIVTGSTAVQNITGEWNDRVVQLITTTGAVAFNTGGTPPNSFCNSVTSGGANFSVLATYDSALTCWLLK